MVKKAEGIKVYEITPRHLLFNILYVNSGRISREKLIDSVYNAGIRLSKKDYKIPLHFKFSLKEGKYSEDLEMELNYWVQDGMLKFKKNEYIFNPKESPVPTLDKITTTLNLGISSSTRKDLIKAVENT